MVDTNAFNPAGFYGVAFEHLPDDASLSVVEGVDVLAGTVGIVAFADLAIIDDPDVLVGDVLVWTNTATFDVFEPADVLAAELATTANLDLDVTETTFDVAAISVFAFTEAVAVIVEAPDVFAGVAGRWEFFYADSEAIRVAWEQQTVVVPGRPKSGENTYHPFITAFDEQGFYPNAFFTGTGAFHYDDDEAIRVPAPAVTERLREDRKSYAAPRRRV